jgi:ribonuclease P protein component
MLPKKQRLCTDEFDLVYKKGKNVNSSLGYFKIRKNNDTKKISCTTSRKVTRKSVDRNRIRRRGYEAVQMFIDDIPEDMHIIWFLPPEALTTPPPSLQMAVKEMINNLDGV